MKKKSPLVLLGALVAFSTLVTACNESCEHVWDAGVITTPATFTMPGVKTYTCTLCGKTNPVAIPVGQSDVYNGEKTDAAYDLVPTLDKLSEAYIVTSNNGSAYVAMTSNAKSDELPWYLVGVEADVSSDKVGADIKGEANKYTFTKQSDGTYLIQDEEGQFLCCYIDDTHYSIGMFTSKNIGSNCKNWNITENANGFTLKGATVDVYLSYSDKGSFCGNKEAPSVPVYFYVKGKGTSTGENQNTQTGGKTGAAAYDQVSLGDSTEAYIITSNNGTEYVAMTDDAKSDALPWYLVPVTAAVSSDKKGADIQGDAEKFKFTKQSDGTYTIQATNGNYLCCYIDGTHYSIGMFAESSVGSNCKFWTITANGTGYTFKGKTVDVYLSYSDKGSICGNKAAPSNPIYLYVKGTGSGTGEGGGTGTGTGGGSDIPVIMPEKDTKWDLNFSQFGTTFRNTLGSLIESRVTSTTSYSGCLNLGMQAAANGNGKYTPFYHGSDYAVSTSTGSNREHTWPNSRGGGDKRGGENIERDPFMVRPTITADNSARGNNFYGTGSNEWDPASCGFEAARGESARVIFYVATRYGQSNGLSLSNNPRDDASKKTMGTLKTLIEWNKKYPVTDMEIQINNYLDNHGYGRNPFVDHPEYADFIWDANGIRTSAPNISTSGDIPGGSTTGGSTTGGTTTGGTTTGGTTTGGTTTGGTTTGGSTGGDEKPYTLIDAIADIDNASAYIVGTNDGKKYYTMTNINPGADLPWYFNGVTANLSSDKKSMSTSSVPLKFTFSKQSDGTYTIKNSNNEYLYSYVEGTHYSIGMSTSTDSSSIKNGTINWNISAKSDGYTLKSPLNVYLQLGNPSFGGTKTAPSYPIYLYK